MSHERQHVLDERTLAASADEVAITLEKVDVQVDVARSDIDTLKDERVWLRTMGAQPTTS